MGGFPEPRAEARCLMPWTKLSDDFGDDCWTLTDAAFRLHVEGLCWSNRKLLDLRIPKADLARFAKDTAVVAELVSVGWWSDDGDVYTIRHHACYQRLAENVLHQQAINKANRRKGRKRPVRDGSSDGSSDERVRTGQVPHLGKEVAQKVEPDEQPNADLPHRCRTCSAPILHRGGLCKPCSDQVITANSSLRSEPNSDKSAPNPDRTDDDDFLRNAG